MTSSAPQETMARDPVCGMEIDPAQAAETRLVDGQTIYFCSQHCAQQFDRTHVTSATTGTTDAEGLRWIELPTVDLDGWHASERLTEQLKSLDGVRSATVNSGARLARVEYDPARTDIHAIVAHTDSSGYTVGRATTWLDIEGMYCASCVSTIEDALERTAGVLDASVNPATTKARVEYLPGHIDTAGLARAVEGAGYRVRRESTTESTADDHNEDDQARKYRTLMRKFWFAAITAIPVMALSFPWMVPGLGDYFPRGSTELRLTWAGLGVLVCQCWSGAAVSSSPACGRRLSTAKPTCIH